MAESTSFDQVANFLKKQGLEDCQKFVQQLGVKYYTQLNYLSGETIHDPEENPEEGIPSQSIRLQLADAIIVSPLDFSLFKSGKPEIPLGVMLFEVNQNIKNEDAIQEVAKEAECDPSNWKLMLSWNVDEQMKLIEVKLPLQDGANVQAVMCEKNHHFSISAHVFFVGSKTCFVNN